MLFDRATNGERLISGSDAAADGRHRSDQSPFRAFLLGRRLCDATQELYNAINTQGDAPPEVRLATASLVEGAGFEPPIGGKKPASISSATWGLPNPPRPKLLKPSKSK
jgi:hypothetical protein